MTNGILKCSKRFYLFAIIVVCLIIVIQQNELNYLIKPFTNSHVT